MGRCRALGFGRIIISFFHLALFKSEGWASSKGGITKTTQGHVRFVPLVDVKP